jgi:hypothetical protein
VLTFHNDLASSGLNSNETVLSPTNVQVGTFGKLFTTNVDGQVYAEPLIDTGITITSGVNTSAGAAGVHDVVFVATEGDSLYAINASSTGGGVLWQRTFLDPTNPTGDINATFSNTTMISTLSSNDVGTTDISPVIGITGTPVIDPTTNLLYVVVKTKETINNTTHFIQRLHAINIGDGTDATAPALIGDTTGTNTNNTSIYVYSVGYPSLNPVYGDGHVTDPYHGTGQQVVQFNALREAERGALSLVKNQVYVEWASHGDNGPYHGWVVVWNVANIKNAGFNFTNAITGVLCTSPNDGLSGIWQGGGRLVFEADGSAFYFETGNGSGGAPSLNSSGFPANANYNEALVKVVPDTQFTSPPINSATQNPNGWGLQVADYFIPYNVSALDGADSDFGSGSPLLLPDSAGIPGHPHLMVASGKEGKIYLIDRDHMGHFDAANDHVLNAVPNGSGQNTPPVQLGGSLSTAAYLNGTIYWVSGYSSYAYSYVINSNGTLSVTSQTGVNNFGYLPGSVVVSANGTNNGIVWVMDRNANEIHAYNASTLATELWNSSQKAGGGDNVGAVVKFAAPTVANGMVYVGTSNSLVVYGLVNPPTAMPDAPALSATALSGSSINLTWTDSTQPPNTPNGYKIEESTNNSSFTQVTTAPAGATSIAIGGLNPLTTYYFRIRGFDLLGNSNYSNTAMATTTSQVALLDFSAGFAGSTSVLTYNGSATINGSKAELTNGGGGQAGSFFSTQSVDVTKFTTQFTFQISPGANTADGLTFCIQGNSATALGPSGGGLGFGPDNTSGTGGIPNSVAVKFDLYSNQGEGVDSTGLYTDGVAPTIPSTDLTPSGIDLHSGDVFQVVMTYDGVTLAVTITDTITSKSATQNYTINIPTTVGNTLAHVGFTGGTGGLVAIQDILTWTYTPTAAASPNAPSGLGAVPASATSVTLNWTNNATNQTGFHLDRATDSGFTQNLITENLPASPNSFTDTFTGLAPGSTFYYRLRAFNAAGDSGNSNSASVTIPLAPPKPTNQQVTDVTTTEIDMSWQDNAGHQADGYHILRAVNHGAFTLVASLPLTSRTPPSTYLWADTGLTPGYFYEYHIIAFNVSGNNDFAGVNATTITLPPSSLKATADIGVINLSWTVPTGAQTYNIYRGTTPGGEGTSPLAIGIATTTYADTAITAGTTYYYTVTAVNANTSIVPAVPSESAPSTEASAAAIQLAISMSTPTDATAGSPISVTLTAVDQFNNVIPDYAGTVHFSSSDTNPASVLPADYPFTAGDNGTHTFSVTLVTAGSQTLTVTDLGNAGLTTTGTIMVHAAAAQTISVAGFLSPITAGESGSFTVTALDLYGNVATGYLGTVSIESSDGQASLPSPYMFIPGDTGIHSFDAILKTAGTQSITVTDTVTGTIKGQQSGIQVTPAAATTLSVTGFPTTTNAGDPHGFTVTAFDSYSNVATGYGGTINFQSSDIQAGLPANYTFGTGNGGIANFDAVLKTAGLQSLTVTDSVVATITGQETNIQVNPAPANTLTVTGFPTTTNAGDSHGFTVTAFDAFGNIATEYAGTITFQSSDPQAGLPSNYTFGPSDGGTHDFTAILTTPGIQSLTATDTSSGTITGQEINIQVNPAAAVSTLTVTGFPTTTNAGDSHSFTVTALDQYGNIATGYTGTIAFQSSDFQAGLPSNYTFVTGDGGSHTFVAVLKTAGLQTLTVQDSIISSLSGSETGIQVLPIAATSLAIKAPSIVRAGTPFTVTVTALDPYHNIATSYNGIVRFRSSINDASLPKNYTFTVGSGGDNGVHTFVNGVTIRKQGRATLTVTDMSNSSITGNTMVVVAGAGVFLGPTSSRTTTGSLITTNSGGTGSAMNFASSTGIIPDPIWSSWRFLQEISFAFQGHQQTRLSFLDSPVLEQHTSAKKESFWEFFIDSE